MKKITIVGTGYVGLVHGATLAELGNQVTCLDIDPKKIDSLKEGSLPFFEPGLEELVKSGMESGRLTFTDDYEIALEGAEVCFMCLPTPSDVDGSCDLSYLLTAGQQVARVIKDYLVIVNKSTVPIGTAQKLRVVLESTLEDRGVDIHFDVVSNPEFLKEGTAVKDSLSPSRILLGVDNDQSLEVMNELYASFPLSPEQRITTNVATAELAKYAANTMLATRISLMNSFSLICEKMGGDIEGIRIAIGADMRIGPSYLHAGIGFGGSCLPKDVKALCHIAEEQGVDASLFNSILQVNAKQREHFYEKIENFFGCLEGKTIAIWGLSFKPDTDDIRKAPSLYLMDRLIEAGASVRVYDPVAIPKTKPLYQDDPHVLFCSDEVETTIGADAVVLVTEWKQFQNVDLETASKGMREKVFFDGRNHLNGKELEHLGFAYFSIGKKSEAPLAIHG